MDPFSRSELKRKMTLDLPNSVIKKTRNSLQTPVFTKQEILSSPDIHKLNLASPELERLILNPQYTPGQFFPGQSIQKPTTEQEDYAKGFENALAQLQNQQQKYESETSDDSDSMTSSSTSYTANNAHEYIKQEQIVPEGVPIDMANQEKIKLERKRQRNRIAASKCRKRKLERISKLEDKVKQIKQENNELVNISNKLRENVAELKKEVMRHVQLGCSIMVMGSGGNY
jgi:transcription factor AP-1